jgi:hypothetical protein
MQRESSVGGALNPNLLLFRDYRQNVDYSLSEGPARVNVSQFSARTKGIPLVQSPMRNFAVEKTEG